MAAQGDDVLERRRRPDGDALRQVEDALRRATRGGIQGLVGAAGEVACPADFQLALRPIREGPARVDLLRRLALPARLPARAGAGLRGEVDLQLQGVPATAEAGQLQRR